MVWAKIIYIIWMLGFMMETPTTLYRKVRLKVFSVLIIDSCIAYFMVNLSIICQCCINYRH